MQSIKQVFQVPFEYQVYFTENMFQPENPLFKDIIQQDGAKGKRKILFVIDRGLNEENENLIEDIENYINTYSEIFDLRTSPLVITGGEKAKNDNRYVKQMLKAIDQFGICRHSYVVAIGGGAILDMVGYTTSIAHRGVRHIRIPTTVLAQNDSGVGVKNSVNAFGKKNFLGCFKPPYAVINDFNFLQTLDDRNWRSGISEAIKVALIKDADFFKTIQRDAQLLNQRDKIAMQNLIYRCAELHMEHIGGGDPFEMGNSRPLDFGHWSAHKLENLTEYTILHCEAVAIGIAIDVIYSHLKGMFAAEDCEQVLKLLQDLDFELYVPQLSQYLVGQHMPSILMGLQEFREHLGGELTVMLLDKIGHGVETHVIDGDLVMKAIEMLKDRSNQ